MLGAWTLALWVIAGMSLVLVAWCWYKVRPSNLIEVQDVVPHDTWLQHRGIHRALFGDLRVGDKVAVLNPVVGYRSVLHIAPRGHPVLRFGRLVRVPRGTVFTRDHVTAAVVPLRKLTFESHRLQPGSGRSAAAVTTTPAIPVPSVTDLVTIEQKHYVMTKGSLCGLPDSSKFGGVATFVRDGKTYSIRTGVTIGLPDRITIQTHENPCFTTGTDALTAEMTGHNIQCAVSNGGYLTGISHRAFGTTLPAAFPIVPFTATKVLFQFVFSEWSEQDPVVFTTRADDIWIVSDNKVVEDTLGVRSGILSPFELSDLTTLKGKGQYMSVPVQTLSLENSAGKKKLVNVDNMTLRYEWNAVLSPKGDTVQVTTTFGLYHKPFVSLDGSSTPSEPLTFSELMSVPGSGPTGINRSRGYTAVAATLEKPAPFWWYSQGMILQLMNLSLKELFPNIKAGPSDVGMGDAWKDVLKSQEHMYLQDISYINMEQDYRHLYCEHHPCDPGNGPRGQQFGPDGLGNMVMFQGGSMSLDIADLLLILL